MDVEECVEVISGLKNKSCGPDSIFTKIFKEAKRELAKPLVELINLSFESGVFPDSLKTASITPVYKAGDPFNVCNYRPISILPLLSKIFEKCMSERLESYLNKHDSISTNQFRFVRGKSSCDAILSLTEELYSNMNKKLHSVTLFVDLCKAYDTLNHGVLLEKNCTVTA